ncbi:tetratricopeptide repeat protein [Hymenobacter sp. PAMC 26628]|uniref:tetratricopeptide repeat protein n=1 Tax=Hymenobacter sp. PAMC 26628 TaxID=1484118 RepID=UPI0009EC83DD|nr:tetratricopeptide repeat protein [Hymenobacter sp. PAMC 26628]
MRCAPIVLLAGLLAAALGLPGCQPAPAERPDTLVDLATVQSGPRVQADELDGALRQQPGNVALLSRRAALRLAAGQPTAALRDASAALDLTDGDDDGPLYFLQARALRMLGRLPEALAAARRAADNGFTGPELPLLVGETHLAARDYPAALDNLDRALRLDPNEPAALFYKGLAYAASADTAQALDYLRAALAREPRQPEILHQLAFLYNALRDPEQAVGYAARGLRLDTASGALHYDYGRQLELKGVADSAAWFYRRALVLDTTQYRADYRLALAAGAHGQRPAALIPHLARALRRNPRLPKARALLAEALEEHNQLPAALAQYRLLVAENPGNTHWTYKVWKVGNRARLLLPDSLRLAPLYYPGPPRARPSAVAPLAPVGGLPRR